MVIIYAVLIENHNNTKKVNSMRVIVCASVLLDFSLNVMVAPHECVIRTSQP